MHVPTEQVLQQQYGYDRSNTKLVRSNLHPQSSRDMREHYCMKSTSIDQAHCQFLHRSQKEHPYPSEQLATYINVSPDDAGFDNLWCACVALCTGTGCSSWGRYRRRLWAPQVKLWICQKDHAHRRRHARCCINILVSSAISLLVKCPLCSDSVFNPRSLPDVHDGLQLSVLCNVTRPLANDMIKPYVAEGMSRSV